MKLFKHFYTVEYRNGWVDSEDVSRIDTEIDTEQPVAEVPEKVVKRISDDIKVGQKTSIIIDFSGSMYDNQRQVIELLEELEFGSNTNIIVFAEKFKVVTPMELKERNFDVGVSTHMFKALNKAAELGTEKLIIISDLLTYEDEEEILPNPKLNSVTIYNPDDMDNDVVIDEMKEKWGEDLIELVRIK